MGRRHRRRGRLTKLLYVLVALFLFSLWNFYRINPGIFYLHISLMASIAAGAWMMAQSVLKARKKMCRRMVWGSTRYTKSKMGQSTTLRRLRARLKVIKGYDVDVPVQVRRRLRGIV